MATEAKTNLVINGVDRTGGAFASVGARAAAAGAQLKSVLGGALAAAGAYLGFRQVIGGINELGHLSDIAQKTNTSVDELTQTTTAMNILGIQNMGVDQFAKSMDYMQKTTGRSGKEGFLKTIEELAKIEDTAKRGQEAVRIFGRSGMEFMPLINGATEGTDALRNVIEAMPAIPQAAADSGDAVSDAMTIASDGIKSIWLQGIGAVCSYFDSQFVGGIRGAAVIAFGWLEYYAKTAVSQVTYYFSQMKNFMSEIGSFWGTFFGAITNGASLSEAIDMANTDHSKTQAANMDDEKAELESLNRRQEAWREAYEERKRRAKEFADAYAAAAKSRRMQTNVEFTAQASAKKSPRLQNKLVMGDSNEARKVATFGPTLQSETKKQTKLLERIAKNQEKKDAETGDVLGVVEEGY